MDKKFPMRLRGAGALFLCFGLALLLVVAYVLRHELLALWVATLLAIMFAPIVRWIEGWRIGRWQPGHGAALVIFCALFLTCVALVILLAVPPILHDLQSIQARLPQRTEQLVGFVNRYLPAGHQLSAVEVKQELGRELASRITPLAAIQLITALLTILLVAAYLILDGTTAFAWIISLFPADQQPRIRHTLSRGGRRMQRWLGGQALLMLIHGGSGALAFGFLHIKYFYLLGLLAGLFNIIPVLGPVLTLMTAGMVAAIDSFGKLFGVVIFYLVYHSAENAFINPKIMESRVHIPAAAVVIALVIGGGLAGIVGILVSVPTAVLIAVIVNEYVASRTLASTPAENLEARKAA